MISLAILVLLSSLATIAGASWVTSARKAKAAAELVDQMSLAREQAIAKHQRWRITFTPAGAPVATGFRLEACALAPGTSPDDDCTGSWEQQGQAYSFELGVGLTNHPQYLTFNRLGHFTNPADAEMQVCMTYSPGGVLSCKPNEDPRLIKIRSFSGIVERY